jgi:SAM-dependent methyltransferase
MKAISGAWGRLRQVRSVPPYAVLAEIYDEVMDHVNYDQWAGYLDQLLRKHGHNVHTVLDASCGTGVLDRQLQQKGYSLWGCDVSLMMVKRARGGAEKSSCWCSDVRHLALRRKPDAIISTYDSMNYLMTADEWQQALDRLYQALPQKGVLIFDVSTVYNSKTAFQRYVQKETTPAGTYWRNSYYRPRSSIQFNEFKIVLTREPKITYHEIHKQKIVSLQKVLDYIAASRFALLAAYADFTFQPAREQAERLHFVLQKRRP